MKYSPLNSNHSLWIFSITRTRYDRLNIAETPLDQSLFMLSSVIMYCHSNHVFLWLTRIASSCVFANCVPLSCRRSPQLLLNARREVVCVLCAVVLFCPWTRVLLVCPTAQSTDRRPVNPPERSQDLSGTSEWFLFNKIA